MTQVVRAADFIQSIGVGAHIDEGGYAGSSYSSSDVGGQMKYLGITNMRVEAPYANAAEYQILGQQGIKFDVLSTKDHHNPSNLAQQMALIDSIAPYVALAEGPNEINTDPITYNGLSGAAAADAYQKDFYTAVHADPKLAGVSVLPFSLSVGGDISGFGNVAAYADFGNVHGYASDGVPPYYMLQYAVQSITTTPGKQAIMTETGNYTLNDGRSGVTQDVQAKWLMDTLLENSSIGVARTYLYQLEDDHTDPVSDPENHYGLFNADGSAKQAATDIHNLTSILADTNAASATFTPGTLNYTLDNFYTGYNFQELFAKSNGSFDIALWSEPQFYNARTGIEGYVAPLQSTVNLGGAYDVNVYDPVIGTAPIATYHNVTSVQVSITTDPLIVEVTPIVVHAAALPPAAPVPSPAPAPVVPVVNGPVTLGTGPDSIVVNVSEDAWKGDAKFTLAVDGQQIGATQTATAIHSLGQTQAYTLNGTFGLGNHVITAYFLNDFTGGGGDRNLYVDSLTASGNTNQLNAFLGWTGPSSFTATIAPPVAATPVVVGPDTIVIGVSEDAYAGDVQATFAIDGQQVGGIQTITALHSQGKDQAVTLNGTFGTGTHLVTTTFLNDLSGAGGDRTLYLDNVAVNGAAATAVNKVMPWTGNSFFNVSIPAAAPPASAVTNQAAGPDNIVVNVSEDAYAGDAQFTLAVDGVQIGGTRTATASHRLGQSQAVTLNGTFGAGKHTVTASFLNDAWGGSAATDRNFYVDSVSAGGTTVAGDPFYFSETHTYTATLPGTAPISPVTPSAATPPAAAPAPVPAAPAGPAPVTLGTGPDAIVVNVSEDAYLGNAQFTLAVDGLQTGGVQTATALHGLGQTQAFTLDGAFGAGKHIVTATFLNDAWGGTANTDRNLYVDNVSAGGTTVAGDALWSNISHSYTATLPGTAPITPVSLGAGTATTAFVLSTGANVIDAGLVGGQTLTGIAGRNAFVVHAGAGSETISNFHADVTTGDFLGFSGYGAGAVLTQIDPKTLQASSASGAIHDLVHLGSAATIVPANFGFL